MRFAILKSESYDSYVLSVDDEDGNSRQNYVCVALQLCADNKLLVKQFENRLRNGFRAICLYVLKVYSGILKVY